MCLEICVCVWGGVEWFVWPEKGRCVSLSVRLSACVSHFLVFVCIINALNQAQQSLHFAQRSLLLEHLQVIRRSMELGFQLVILTFPLLHHDLTVVPAYQR